MHILQITPSYPPNHGGVETHVFQLTHALVEQKHDVKIISGPIVPLPDEKKVADKTVWRLSSSSAKKKVWMEIWQHRQLFQEAEIVHVHDVFWWLLPVYPLIWHKTYLTFHGWETQWPIRWQAKLHRQIASWLSRGRVHIGDWIKEFYWDKPSLVLYGGVSQVARTIHHTHKPHNLNLVFIGRLEPDNQVFAYIELVKMLRYSLSKKNKVNIIWVGDGTLRPLCEAVGKVTGWVNQPEKHLQAADFVLANSYLSILEAQAVGKVVIGIHETELKRRYLETYPGGKMMVLAASAYAANKQILDLLTKKADWVALEKKAHTYAEQQTWGKIAEQYLRLWQGKKTPLSK